MLPRAVLHVFLCFGTLTIANVEKVIFTTPAKSETPSFLSTLVLDVLSPQQLSLRKHLQVEFPSAFNPKGLQSWYLLDGLEPSQRHEVRICWAATQPTSFWLSEYTLDQVIGDSFLTNSLTNFSSSQQGNSKTAKALNDLPRSPPKSRLLLQIFATADYYTTNKTLMKFPEPVHVDIILDPYILGVLPQSLLPTVLYILLIAVGSWYLSDFIWTWLRDLSQSQEADDQQLPGGENKYKKQHAE